MNKQYEEIFGPFISTSANLWPFLEKSDADFAQTCREQGCLHCGGKLHQANYERKPRGIDLDPNQTVLRFSFCCEREGCRKRHTPASVRFFGRRVYVSVVFLLVSAMHHGLTPKRVHALRQALNLKIDRRTLQRWCAWWLEDFVQSAFWKQAKARFMPAIGEGTLPLSLSEAFKIGPWVRLLALLKFLRPLTATLPF